MIKNFLKNKKMVFTALAVVVLIATLAPQLAGASKEGLEIDSSLLNDSVSYGLIGNLLMGLIGRLLAMAAVAVDFAINLGNDILILDAVQKGWTIMLQFTNLGFILGIIIIAFATILHIESYALKQILWKLIVAALLVNFSLVIAGAFISISNITSAYFIEATSTSNLAEALGNAIQPQKLQTPPSTTGENIINWFSGLAPAGWIKYLINIFFIVIFGFLAALTLLTLFIMLLVRVIALIFLLILSPLIWLCWIFPSTQQYWSKWWSEFIKWNFFAPAVLFFVYLSVLTSQQLDRANESLPSLRWLKTTPIISSLDSFFGINDFIYTALRLIVILSLLIGGIFVANKFGIAGGDIGVNLALKVGKGAGAWAGRRGMGGLRRAGSGVFGNERVRGWGEKLQKLGSGSGWVGRTAASLSVNKLGNAIGRVGTRTGESRVKEAEKQLGHLSDVELGRRMHQFDAGKRQFALQKMAKNGTLGLVAGGAGQYITKSEKDIWARHGQGKQFGDLTVAHGGDENVGIAIKSGNEKAIQDAMTKFTGILSTEDMRKMGKNVVSNFDKDKNNPYGVKTEQEHDVIRKINILTRLDNEPASIHSLQSKVRGNDLTYINSVVSGHVSELSSQMPQINGKNWHEASYEDKIKAVQGNKTIQGLLRNLLRIENKEAMSASYLVSKFDKIFNLDKHLAGFLSEEWGGESKTSISAPPSPSKP